MTRQALPKLALAARSAVTNVSAMSTTEQELAILRNLSPARKLAVLRGLIRQAYRLREAAIRARWPDLSDTEVWARTRAAVGGDRS